MYREVTVLHMTRKRRGWEKDKSEGGSGEGMVSAHAKMMDGRAVGDWNDDGDSKIYGN